MDDVVQFAANRVFFPLEAHHPQESRIADGRRPIGIDRIEALDHRIEEQANIRLAATQSLRREALLRSVAQHFDET